MNELIRVTPQPPAMSIPEIETIARAIATGGLFGSRDPAAVLTLCLLAHAEGQHPAVVFRDYHIIQGKPAKKAEAMLRDFISSGGKVEWHELSDAIADATFSHPQGGTIRIDWTMKRAQQAGIANPMWKKYPRQMLRSRVISEGVRSVCPSATSGLYEVGEVQDIVGERVPAVEAQVGGGDNAESTVSPAAEPSTLRDQLEQSVAQEVHHDDTAGQTKRQNWGGRYPNKTALRKARTIHHAELERIGVEGTFDDLEAYLTSPEYKDYIAQADEHFPFWLGGEIPAEFAEQCPPEYVQTFDLETKVRDCIALRGNVAAEPADV
jgi:hypothetical protein